LHGELPAGLKGLIKPFGGTATATATAFAADCTDFADMKQTFLRTTIKKLFCSSARFREIRGKTLLQLKYPAVIP